VRLHRVEGFGELQKILVQGLIGQITKQNLAKGIGKTAQQPKAINWPAAL
jgi:hypothetical protein